MARKKERYRLQALLRVKQRNKRNAELELAKAFSALKEEQERLKILEEEKDEIIRKRDESRREMALKVASGESQVSDSHQHLSYIRNLLEEQENKEKEIEEQKEQIKKAEERVGQAKKAYIEACKQLKIMEKHKELWKKKIARSLAKDEAKIMNELGNVLHQLRHMRVERGDWQ